MSSLIENSQGGVDLLGTIINQNNLISALSSLSGSSNGTIQSNSIWVDPNGNDSTGNGTIGNPYKSIAHAISRVSGQGSNNRFAIMIAPGLYNETTIAIPPWVWLVGLHPGTDTQTERVKLVSGTLGIDTVAFASWPTDGATCGMSSLAISPNINIVATGFTNKDIEITIDHCLFFGNITATFDSPGSYLSLNHIENVGSINITGGGGQIVDGVINNTINWALQGSTIIQGVNCLGMTLSQGPSATGGDPVQIIFSSIPNLSISGAGLVVTADAVSIPLSAAVIVSGGASLIRSTDANALAYTPSISANWISQPSNLQDAIDKLASRVKALSG
jgi:hypothetical protein